MSESGSSLIADMVAALVVAREAAAESCRRARDLSDDIEDDDEERDLQQFIAEKDEVLRIIESAIEKATGQKPLGCVVRGCV